MERITVLGGEAASIAEDVISVVKDAPVTAARLATKPVMLGISLGILSNVLSASGLITQRYASLRNPNGDNKYWKCFWVLGLVVYIAASGPDVASYMFAPETTLAVVGSLEPIFVAVLSLYLLPEDAKNFTKKEALATLLCVSGAIGCIFCSPSGNSSQVKLVDLSPGPLIYFGMMAVCILGLCWLEYFAKEGGIIASIRPLALPCLAAFSLACSKLFNTNLGTLLVQKNFNVAAAWQQLPALMSLIFMVLCSLSCFYHVSRGMQVMAPYAFMPVYFGVCTIMQFMQSMTILGEYEGEHPGKVVFSVICALSVLAGVLLMNSAEMKRTKSAAGNYGSVASKKDLSV